MQDNSVIFAGFLGKDAELFSNGEMESVSLSIANSRKTKTGEQKSTWMNVKVYDSQQIITARDFKKGDNVFVKGSLNERKWTDKKTGIERSTIEIWATVAFKIPRDKTKDKPVVVAQDRKPYKEDDSLDEIPF